MKKEAKKLDELTIKKLNPKMWKLLYEKNVKKKKRGGQIYNPMIDCIRVWKVSVAQDLRQ